MPSHHLQGVSNGAQSLVQSPNSRVLAFGHRGFNTTTAATSEPWPLKSCPGLQKSTLFVKQQMPLKRSWLKQDKLISKSGQRNIKASYYQNHCLLLTSSGSSLITQRKLFKGQQSTVFCAARYVHTYSFRSGALVLASRPHTWPTNHLPNAACSHCSNTQAAWI